MSDIPENQGRVLTDLASSGDSTAKSWASELGIEPKPATTGNEDKGQDGAADKAKPEGGTKGGGEGVKDGLPKDEAKPDGEAKDGVDAHRDGAGDKGKNPSIYAEVRRLKQERRQLRTERDQSRQREESLNSRLAALEARPKASPDGSKPAATEEDALTQLLSDPKKFLAERDKSMLAAIREALQSDMAQARAAEQGRAEKSSAIKTLESIPDFNLDKDEDEVFEIMEKEYGLNEEDVEELLATRPQRTANWIKRAWEKSHSTSVSDSVRADKASAKASGGGGGRMHSKSSLAEVNARAKGGMTAAELEKAWEDAGKLT